MKYAKFRCNLCGVLPNSEHDLETWFVVSINSKGNNSQPIYYRGICPDCLGKIKKNELSKCRVMIGKKNGKSD